MDFLNIIVNFWNKYKSQIILSLALIIAILFILKGCTDNRRLVQQYDNNIAALTEEVQTWKTKSGNLVAEKTILEGDINLLKQTNEDLYKQVKELKNKPKEVVYINTEIVHEVHDTTFVVSPDSTYIKKSFDFSNNWRKLTGFIEYNKPNLNLTIDNDIVYTDFTVAIKDSKVFVTSNNPYVQYNDIQGVTLPKYNKPMFSVGIGPSIGVGYNIVNKTPGIYFGVAINAQYNLLSFGYKK